MTNEFKDIDTNDEVPYERNDNVMTKVKWSIETNDIDNDFLREYDNMCKSMEDSVMLFQCGSSPFKFKSFSIKFGIWINSSSCFMCSTSKIY